MYLPLFLSSCLILVIPRSIGINAVQYAPEVSVTGGKIRGKVVTLPNTAGVVRNYLGIPFAKAERFKSPEDPVPWNKVRDATSFGKICPQKPDPPSVEMKDMSEAECLNLNVHVPVSNSSNSSLTALPVMVWIYGGAFTSGANRIYDGSYIATLGNVIVVAINYRLAVFGFLATGKDGDLKGNYGMLDQVKGLEWVKKNIAGFGGDPNKVTIFGESAGGASVSLLMLSPLAKGLFHNVIVQSGAPTALWAAFYYHEAEVIAKAFAKQIGCQDMKEIVECLKLKTLEQIVNTSLFFAPVIDGTFIPDSPSVLLEKGQFEKYNTMMGVNNDEGSVAVSLTGKPPGMVVQNGVQRAVFTRGLKTGLIKVMRNQNPLLTEAVIYRYTDWTNVTDPYRNRRMLLDMMGDSMFVAPAINSLEAYVNKASPTYFYQLQYRLDFFLGKRIPSWIKAFHAADILFVFGFPLRFSAHSKDSNFSRAIISLWTNFAKTGNPNDPNGVGISWPQYDLTNQQYLALKPNPGMAVKSKLRAEYVAFWNNFIPDALRVMPTTRPVTTGVIPSKASAMTTGLFTFSIGLLSSCLGLTTF